MPLYFEGITSSSIRPSIFFFQPLIYLECHRTDLDHIQHAIKARPPVRLTRIWIFLAAFRPAVAQLAVSIRSQETTGCAFYLVSVFLITFQQIFFNKLIFCKPRYILQQFLPRLQSYPANSSLRSLWNYSSSSFSSAFPFRKMRNS